MRTYFLTFGHGKDAVTMQEDGDLLAILKLLKFRGWETQHVTDVKTVLRIEDRSFDVNVRDAHGWGYFATVDDCYDGTPGIWIAHSFTSPEHALGCLQEQIEDAILSERI